jgi:hypothetical protein
MQTRPASDADRWGQLLPQTLFPKQHIWENKNHMESLFHMGYMFLCPQGDTVYTDNTKLRGYAKNISLINSPRKSRENVLLAQRY